MQCRGAVECVTQNEVGSRVAGLGLAELVAEGRKSLGAAGLR
jgi:hypothetical protein